MAAEEPYPTLSPRPLTILGYEAERTSTACREISTGRDVSREDGGTRGGVWRGAHSAMSQARALPQSKETLLQSYNKRLRDDVKSIMDNFTEIIKTAKVRLGSAGVAAREAGSLAPAAAGLLHC